LPSEQYFESNLHCRDLLDPHNTELLSASEEHALNKYVQIGQYVTALQAERPDNYKLSLHEQRAIEFGKQARDRFITSNQKLIGLVVSRLEVPEGLEIDDVFQEGQFGLMEAVDLYEADRGYRFSTFAYYHIYGAARRFIDEKRHLSHISQDRITAAFTEASETKSLNAISDINQKVLQFISPVYLNEPVSEDITVEKGDYLQASDIPTEVQVTEHLMCIEVLSLAAELGERELYALLMRVGFITGQPESLAAVANKLSLSKMYTSRLLNKTIEHVRRRWAELDALDEAA
jgi:RNA polymerase primary sigma factor